MTLKECVTALNFNTATLTKSEQTILTAFENTTLVLCRTTKAGALSKTYAIADVSAAELKRILNDFMTNKSSAPSTMYIYEGT